MTSSGRYSSLEHAGVAIIDDLDATFERLFHQHERPICAYLARLTGDVARAQELTQETFIRAYRALARGARLTARPSPASTPGKTA